MNVAGWMWSFPSKGDDLRASNLEFAEVVSKTFWSFKDYFRPDWVRVHWRTTRNVIRKEAEHIRRWEFLDRTMPEKWGSTTGFEPDDVRRLILKVIARDRENAHILSVFLDGLTRIFDVNENGQVSEMWELRDTLPEDWRGTLVFEFRNPYPRDFNVRISTHSLIFIPDILNIDNTEIATRNIKALEEQFRKFEREAGAKQEYAASEDYDELVWKYGFR